MINIKLINILYGGDDDEPAGIDGWANIEEND